MKNARTLQRQDVIVLFLPAADDDAARAEIRRQLPDDWAHAAWVRVGARVALCRTGNEKIADGAVLAPGILASSGPIWIVPPKRRSWRNIPRTPLLLLMLTSSIILHRMSTHTDTDLRTLGREKQRQDDVLRKTTVATSRLPFLAGLGTALPVDSHLVDLSIDESTGRLRIRGRATDFGTVSAFSRAVKSLPGIGVIQPGKADVIRIGGKPVVEFSLEATLT